jgi:hypothetical protein
MYQSLYVCASLCTYVLVHVHHTQVANIEQERDIPKGGISKGGPGEIDTRTHVCARYHRDIHSAVTYSLELAIPHTHMRHTRTSHARHTRHTRTHQQIVNKHQMQHSQQIPSICKYKMASVP